MNFTYKKVQIEDFAEMTYAMATGGASLEDVLKAARIIECTEKFGEWFYEDIIDLHSRTKEDYIDYQYAEEILHKFNVKFDY